MKLETFEKAEFILNYIRKCEKKKIQIQQMKMRENDEEFNLAREIAEDSIQYVISRFENDFEAI